MSRCLVCGSGGSVPLVSVGSWLYRSCRDCGAAFLSDQDLAAQSERHMGRSYKLSRLRAELQDDRHNKWLSETLPRWAPPPGRLLEVGCGSGMFLAEAERLGYRVTGLDLGPENRLFAAEFLGVEVLDGDFLAAEFEHRFDWLVMHQLIEHVAAPGQYVDKARQVLKPGGHLMITTPNLAFARPITQVLKWLGQPPIGDALGHPPNHCVLFEPKTIRWLLGSKGFSVISIQTNPTGLKKQRPVRRLIDSTMLRIPKPLGPNMLIVARSGLNSPNGL